MAHRIYDRAARRYVAGNPNAAPMKWTESPGEATQFDSKADAKTALERRGVHSSIVRRWVTKG